MPGVDQNRYWILSMFSFRSIAALLLLVLVYSMQVEANERRDANVHDGMSSWSMIHQVTSMLF